MRARTVLMRAALLLSVGVAAKNSAQVQGRTMDSANAPGLITDTPFTATWQDTLRDHGRPISQTTIRMARASNGSIYVATFSSGGTPSEIDIDDVPNNRMITLNPLDHTYGLSKPPSGKFHTLSVQQATEMLEKQQELNAKGVEHPPNLRVTSLGVKQEDGMTLYGEKQELHLASEEIRYIWISSDLCVKASMKYIWPSEEKDWTGTISDVRREEPDPKLFKIPEGYTQI